MKGLHLLKEILKQGDYLCKLDLKNVYLCVPLNEQSRKNLRFKWEGSLYVPLSVFWTQTSPKLFYKISKCASLHPSQIVYRNNIITRQLSDTRENFGGNNLKQGYCDLPVTEARICYKLKEISSSPNTENRG